MSGAPPAREPTVLIVPGLRDHVAQHWQTLLEPLLPRVRSVPPMGRADLDRFARVQAIEQAAAAIEGPLVLVAHSGGCITVAHWARQTRRAVHGALLAVPPDMDAVMPEGYPSRERLQAAHWTPVPRARLPFRSIVALSRNDPLGRHEVIAALAADWGSETVDLGDVGHLNPAAGYGPWPRALDFIAQLCATAAP